MLGAWLVNTSFIIFIALNAYFYIHNIVKTTFDYIMSGLALIVSIGTIYSVNYDKKRLLDASHFLYTLYLCVIALFSSNAIILSLNVIMLIAIIWSRYYYECCLLSKCQKRKGYFYDIGKTLKLNWNYLFPLFLFISATRLAFLAKDPQSLPTIDQP